MASDPKASSGSPGPHREKGVRIFTYPKIIFIFPSLIMSLICWLGMWMTPDVAKFNFERSMGKDAKAVAKANAEPKPVITDATGRATIDPLDPADQG